MMKKIVSILLAAVMLLSVFALVGCSSQPDDQQEDDKSSEGAKTVVMWLVTNESTKSEAIREVQNAINEITEQNFKTRVILQCYTEDEYYKKLEEAILYREGQLTDEDVNADEVETIKNEFGFNEIKYPDPKPYQVDILYLSGMDRYYEYADLGYLEALDDLLDDQGKKWTKYISESVLAGVQYEGVTYAVPNYNRIGEYRYMLIDRQLYDEYYLNATVNEIRNVFDLEPFVYRVSQYQKDVLPIASTFEDLKDQLAFFWTVNPETLEWSNDFSVVGYTYKDYSILGRGQTVLEFQNLFSDSTFTKNFSVLMEYKLSDAIGEAKEGQRVAVQFVNGTASTLDQYGAVLVEADTNPNELYGQIKDDDSVKYYAVKVGYPTATEEDLFTNLFGLYAGSKNSTQSMKVLNELNTNTELRDLLQYGIQGKNYELTANGQVRMLNDDYSMDLEKTGNVMIATMPEGTDPLWKEHAYIQNRETLVDPLFQFTFNTELDEVYPDETFMSSVEITENMIKIWSRIYTRYMMYDEETEDYVPAGDKYDSEKIYYSWEDTRPNYVIMDENGLYQECPDKYDPNEVYYAVSFDMALARRLKQLSEKTWDEFMNMTTMEQVSEKITQLASSLNSLSNPDMEKSTVLGYESLLASPYKFYYDWLSDNRYLPGSDD